MPDASSRDASHDDRMGPQRALITGATGFIGSRLARQLLDSGWNVHVLLRPNSQTTELAPVWDRLVPHTFDGTTDAMNALVREARPDVVFHLASLFLAQHKPDDIRPLIESNITLGTQLLEAMAANGVRSLVNTGTSWQHYESRPYSPVCLYAATKQAFEAIVRHYVETTGLKVIHLKLFDSYGPGDPRPKLLRLLAKAAESQEELAMSPGAQLIDMVHVDDIVAAFELAAARLVSGRTEHEETFAVSSQRQLSLRDLVGRFEEETGVQVRVNWGVRPYRPREVMVPWSSGRALPGWEPSRTWSEGYRSLRAGAPAASTDGGNGS